VGPNTALVSNAGVEEAVADRVQDNRSAPNPGPPGLCGSSQTSKISPGEAGITREIVSLIHFISPVRILFSLKNASSRASRSPQCVS
jgi:hypothetical protein